MIHFIGAEGLVASDAYRISTMDKLLSWIQDKKVIAVDTETQGFFDHKNKVIMLQLGTLEDQWVIDTRYTNIEPLRQVLESRDVTKIFWNAAFDYKHIKYSFGISVEGIHDNFLVECILTTGKDDPGLSLNHACDKYLGIKMDKTQRTSFLSQEGKPFTDNQIVYGAIDVEYLINIREAQLVAVNEFDLSTCVRLENRFVSVLSDIEYKGFYLDREDWLALSKENTILKEEARKILDEYVVSNGHTRFIDTQMDMFNTEVRCSINWASSRQVIPYLQFLGVDTKTVDRKTGKVKDTCEEIHIKKFRKKFPFIDLYLKYKGIEKEVSTYGEDFLEHINPSTGRVHSSFWQIISTGRISSSSPNLQNIPSADENGDTHPMRKAFKAKEGNVLIISDYSQQEPRVTADKSQDPSLIDLFVNGDGDTHSLVASKMFSVIEGKPVVITKKDPRRQIGKVLNLKLDYGGSAYTVKDDLGTTEQEAQVFIDALKKAFPKKEEYFKRVIEDTMSNGYILIDDITKRKCFIPEIDIYREKTKELSSLAFANRKSFDWSSYYKIKGSIERNSKNYPKLYGTLLSD